MGKQSSIIIFTGKLGDRIGYRRNGEYFVRGVPAEVKQTLATRAAARRFGIASRKAKLVRLAFSELSIRNDSSHINRLNKVFIQNKALTGFRFNKQAGIEKVFNIQPKLTKEGILHIPPQQLLQCTTLEVKVVAARIDFITRQIVNTETAMIVLDPREPFAGADLSVNISGKGTLVVTIQVSTSTGKYLAADIVAVSERQPVQKVNYPRPAESPIILPEEHSVLHLIQRE